MRSTDTINQRPPRKTALRATMAVHALLSILLSVAPARAQGTVMPIPLAQWFDNFGAPLTSGGLCVFAAGTSTLATTYTTAALSVANANPILMNSAGRPTSGGVFLRPGTSYKFVLKSSTVTTCVPDTGTTIWSVDNVAAVPGSASAVDVTGTAGESISAGESVFLSNGTGSLNQGQWYKTDSDLTYKSTYAAMVGVAPNAVNSGEIGSFRISGSVTTTGLNAGSAYFAGATPGAIVTAPPTNAIRIGQASSATVLIVGEQTAPIGPRGPPCGRLTLTTGVPYTTADVTAATTVYYTPAGNCNSIFLNDGTAWTEYAFAELSIAVPATTLTVYDVFAYDNAGVVALELTAWTNTTTRATATVLLNGVWVKSGVTTRRYVGTFMTTGVSGQTESSFAKRYVWNQDNRMRLIGRVNPSADSWTYTLATYQQWAASAANQLDFVIGQIGPEIVAECQGYASNAGAISVAVSLGVNGITSHANTSFRWETTKAGVATSANAALAYYPAVGRNFVTALEQSEASGLTTWLGDNGGATQVQAGIWGWTEG